MKIDFTPVLMAIVLAFVVIGSAQFVLTMPGAERGLVLFEQTCPLRGQ